MKKKEVLLSYTKNDLIKELAQYRREDEDTIRYVIESYEKLILSHLKEVDQECTAVSVKPFTGLQLISSLQNYKVMAIGGKNKAVPERVETRAYVSRNYKNKVNHNKQRYKEESDKPSLADIIF